MQSCEVGITFELIRLAVALNEHLLQQFEGPVGEFCRLSSILC